MGTTSIVSKIPGPIDIIIEDETALTVAPKNSTSLYEAMQKMFDEAFNRELSNNAVAFIKESFDQEILMRYILENKLELLKGNE